MPIASLLSKKFLAQLKAEGKTIFYSSHIMDTVEKLSDRILILNNGKIVADGPFNEIRHEAEGTLEELFNELTGFDEHFQLAEDFLEAMKGAEYDG